MMMLVFFCFFFQGGVALFGQQWFRHYNCCMDAIFAQTLNWKN